MPVIDVHSVTCWLLVQDLSENNLGRDTSISRAIGDALRANIGVETLILARTTYTLSTTVIYCRRYNTWQSI